MPAPGQLVFVLKPTPGAKVALSNRKQPKTRVKLIFTPKGGSPTTQSRNAQLKP